MAQLSSKSAAVQNDLLQDADLEVTFRYDPTINQLHQLRDGITILEEEDDDRNVFPGSKSFDFSNPDLSPNLDNPLSCPFLENGMGTLFNAQAHDEGSRSPLSSLGGGDVGLDLFPQKGVEDIWRETKDDVLIPEIPHNKVTGWGEFQDSSATAQGPSHFVFPKKDPGSLLAPPLVHKAVGSPRSNHQPSASSGSFILQPPPSPSGRKRHYSESAVSEREPCMPSTFQSHPVPSPAFQSRPIPPLRSSSKKNKKRRLVCEMCNPSIPKLGIQQIFLEDLPVELLIEIFTFACSSLPIRRKTLPCKHKRGGNVQFSSPERATTGFLTAPRKRAATSSRAALDENPDSEASCEARAKELPWSLRLLQARTLLYIQLTCKKFSEILLQHQEIDNRLWREATLACFPLLPSKLGEVQGMNKASQTSWRNYFGVAIRCSNGLFRKGLKRRNGVITGGGVGGVESFGGTKGFKAAVLWEDEKKIRAVENGTMTGSEHAAWKGKQKATEVSIPPRRKLLLVCIQPGPDVFTLYTDKELGRYELGMVLDGQTTVFIGLDEYGRFGKHIWSMPSHLRRNSRGRFPPDCFEVVGDRFAIAKVKKSSMLGDFGEETSPQSRVMEEVQRWDLSCVPEYVEDHRASVARCASRDEWLVFNMLGSFEGFIEVIDQPTEDAQVFCVALQQEMAHSSPGGSKSILKWQRTFAYADSNDYPPSRRLHYNVCNMKLNSTQAVVLIRWNVHSQKAWEEFVDRQFHILDLETGTTVKLLQFPNFHWDFRHHDMTVGYNVMRHYKMKRMFSAQHAGHRATRVHEDEFVLTDDRIVCGSHDYCNWVWDLRREYPAKDGRVFTPLHNDAGNGDPFTVLDDFYWKNETDENEKDGKGGVHAWNTSNERAGWWVTTPNQVLCFWHGVGSSIDGRWFAAVRAGRMFVWDLEDITKVQGFSCATGTYATNTHYDPSVEEEKLQQEHEKYEQLHRQLPTVETRYLGKLKNTKLEDRLKNWFPWEGIIPEQGLWLMYDDGTVVYLNRDDILDACGLKREQGRQGQAVDWFFKREDFGERVEVEEDWEGGLGHSEDDEDEDEDTDVDDDDDDDDDDRMDIDENLPPSSIKSPHLAAIASTNSISDEATLLRIKRRRTNTGPMAVAEVPSLSLSSTPASNIPSSGPTTFSSLSSSPFDKDIVTAVQPDNALIPPIPPIAANENDENWVFEIEKGEAVTMEEMDEEGYWRKVKDGELMLDEVSGKWVERVKVVGDE